MSGGVDRSEFLAGYLAEVEEHLAASSRNLLAIEAGLRASEASPRPVRELFRALHTIKGLSAMVGIEPVVELAHAMESALRLADRAGGRLSADGVDVLAAGLRVIEQQARAVAEDTPVAPPGAALLAALAALEPEGAPKTQGDPVNVGPDLAAGLTPSEAEQLAAGVRSGRRALRVDFAPSAARSARGVNITAVRKALEQLGDVVKTVPMSTPATDAAPGGVSFAILLLTAAADAAVAGAADCTPAQLQNLAAAPGAPALADLPFLDVEESVPHTGVVRVSVARLDEALDGLSALVVSRFRLERAALELAANGTDVRALTSVLQDNARQLKHLRAAIMRARMVTTAELFERLPLLVRGLARATGKKVRLEVEAGDGELDKGVAERIFPALVHLVRNAVDHALEPPDERQRAGKPAEGLIRLACFERGSNQLEVTVADDGRGIDREEVARRAGRAAPTTDQELLALITLPGLSTRVEATTTSGRGMGMDIAKRAIDELAGELSLATHAGRGTTFTLRIPLTITIVDALAFRCGPQVFMVPVAGVEEIVELDPLRILQAPSGKGRAELRMIERQGVAVPLIALNTVFHLSKRPEGVRKALVVKRLGQPFAFEVDQLLRQQEVVVRPLEDPLVRTPGVVGATDLGDGNPTLVLDLIALSGRLSRRRTDLRS